MTSRRHDARVFARPPLMLVTDRSVVRGALVDVVRAAVRGGVDLVQVREPGLGAGALLALVRDLLPGAREGGARVVVNDRIDVALAAGADGVHLKRGSLLPAEARRLLDDDRIIGVSTHTAPEVEQAFAEGADYVVFGPVFATPSKEGLLAPRGAEKCLAISAAARGPVLALGGVCRDTLREFGSGRPGGLAAIRALAGAADPEAAARWFRGWLSGEEEQ